MAEDRAAALVVLNEGADGDSVRRWFEQRGFTVGPLVGISFSIEGPRSRLEECFADFASTEGASGGELSLNALPPDMGDAVKAVVIEAPPDFGPGNP